MIDGKPRSVYARTEAGAIAKVNGLRLRLAQGLDTSSAERIERWQHEMEAATSVTGQYSRPAPEVARRQHVELRDT